MFKAIHRPHHVDLHMSAAHILIVIFVAPYLHIGGAGFCESAQHLRAHTEFADLPCLHHSHLSGVGVHHLLRWPHLGAAVVSALTAFARLAYLV